jgi:hypothetical protein
MGPPAHPPNIEDDLTLAKVDRAEDVTQLQDIMHGTGVNVQDEEELLASSFRNVVGASFTSNSSTGVSPNASFSQASQGLSSHPALSGSLHSQPVQVQEAREREEKSRRELAARVQAENAQEPLNQSFLLANAVRSRLTKAASEAQVKINLNGIYDKVPEGDPRPDRETKPHGLIQPTAPLIDVLSLIGLAANERIRGLLEDAFEFSRGRRTTADGVVPPEWTDLAIGNGERPTTAHSENITNTPWDRVASPAGSAGPNPLKRKLPHPRLMTIR